MIKINTGTTGVGSASLPLSKCSTKIVLSPSIYYVKYGSVAFIGTKEHLESLHFTSSDWTIPSSEDPLNIWRNITKSDSPKLPIKDGNCYAFPCQSGLCYELGLCKKGGSND